LFNGKFALSIHGTLIQRSVQRQVFELFLMTEWKSSLL
jgi:hypothetical protein